MGEKRHDRSLNIRTMGLREWKDKSQYNRCEATPYRALEALFNAYKLNKNDKLVDFGSGRGRVAFYIHNRFHIQVVGIEANDETIDEAIKNKQRYRQKAGHIKAPIYFEYGLAESYEIKADENKFYFFNPFSIKIFRKVIQNILTSVDRDRRTVDIIVYYPLAEYKNFLRTKTPFQMINKIRVGGARDKLEKFVIYRYSGPEDELD